MAFFILKSQPIPCHWAHVFDYGYLQVNRERIICILARNTKRLQQVRVVRQSDHSSFDPGQILECHTTIHLSRACIAIPCYKPYSGSV